MDAHMNGVLHEIRERLFESDGSGDFDHYDEDDDFELSETDNMYYQHRSSAPGIGQATNVSDVHDVFERYIEDAVESIMVQYGLPEDAAVQCVKDATDELVGSGVLPPVPDDDQPEAIAEWMGRANSVGWLGYACKCAHEMAGGY